MSFPNDSAVTLEDKSSFLETSLNIKKKFTFTGHHAGIYTLCEGPDEHSVLSGSADKFIAQWDIEKGEQKKFSARLPAAVYSLLPMYQLDQLWAGTGNGHIHVIDLEKKEEIHALRFHQLAVFDLKFNPVTRLIYSSGADGILNLYDPENLKHVHAVKLSASKIRSIGFYGEDILLAEGSGKVMILDLKTLQVKEEFQGHKDAANCFYIDRENALLYSGGRDAHLNLWDIKNNYSLIRSVPAHNFAIYKIIDLAGTGLMASASRDKTIKIWEKESLKVLARINKEKFGGHAYSVNALHWNSELKILVSASDDRTLVAWELDA